MPLDQFDVSFLRNEEPRLLETRLTLRGGTMEASAIGRVCRLRSRLGCSGFELEAQMLGLVRCLEWMGGITN